MPRCHDPLQRCDEIGCLLLRRPLRGLLPSLAVVFAVSLLAQIVAKIPAVSYYGFESVFFSVLFGLVIRNVWRVPEWMKPAIQGEFYIKIGVVCLGATILFSDVMKSGVFGLVQACLVVAVVWFFAYWVSRRMKVDERTAMILSSGVSICGVSACITAALTWQPVKYLRCQLNYTYEDYAARDVSGRNVVALMLSGIF